MLPNFQGSSSLTRPSQTFAGPLPSLAGPPGLSKDPPKTLTPTYHSSFHFIFHYPNISPIYSTKPYITHYSSFHFLFHYPNKIRPGPAMLELPSKTVLDWSFAFRNLQQLSESVPEGDFSGGLQEGLISFNNEKTQ